MERGQGSVGVDELAVVIERCLEVSAESRVHPSSVQEHGACGVHVGAGAFEHDRVDCLLRLLDGRR